MIIQPYIKIISLREDCSSIHKKNAEFQAAWTEVFYLANFIAGANIYFNVTKEQQKLSWPLVFVDHVQTKHTKTGPTSHARRWCN